ncbi:hypothetical protein DFJ73DRAFT_867496 [Zopfochytrium polystomum]|nr:hypothetical protein DFJ73DRAFT_867494 [Zopfochytrium polystomum]KAI9326002.1 hypothetical protein DFJ73DRAFT_867496 [Zopfochytrium polystomum]
MTTRNPPLRHQQQRHLGRVGALLLLAVALSTGPSPPILAHAATTTASYCDSSNSFCVSAQRDTSTGDVTFAMQSTESGWVAVGLGSSQMAGATMFIGWTNSGSPILSQRTGTGHTDPTVSSSQSFSDVSTTLPSWVTSSLSSAKLTVVFTLTSSSLVSTTSATSCIWAINSRSPTTPSSSSSSISQHTTEGSFSLDLSGSGASDTSGTTTTSTKTSSSAAATATAEAGTSVATYCDGASNFCVSARRDVANAVVTYNLQSTKSGWVGFGVGSSTMVGSTMYIAYSNGNGGITLSQRTASGQVQPTLSSSQSFTNLGTTTVPSWATTLSGAKLVANFNRSITATGANTISTTGATSCIWAVSPNTPTDPTSTSSTFVQHSDFGSFTLDVSSVGSVSSGSSTSSAVILDVPTLRLLHGIFMFLGWAVFPVVGIFTARYLKDALGHNWYRIHVGCMVGGTLLFTALGLAAIELQVSSTATRFIGDATSSHRPLGTVIALAILPLQTILGYVSNALFNPTRTSIPWWDQLHWWVGRVVVCLAVIELYLGLDLYGSSIIVKALYWVWIVLVVGVLVGGHFFYGGAVHHTASSGTAATAKPANQNLEMGEVQHLSGDGTSQAVVQRAYGWTSSGGSHSHEQQQQPQQPIGSPSRPKRASWVNSGGYKQQDDGFKMARG